MLKLSSPIQRSLDRLPPRLGRLGQIGSGTLRLIDKGYRSLADGSMSAVYEMAMPLQPLRIRDNRIVNTVDFMPDSTTFSGAPFERSPHLDFVRQYLAQHDFDYRNTLYYRLAQSGHLPIPCRGAEEADACCRRFIYLINRIRDEGYQPAQFSPIRVVDCVDGSIMVLDGKHRLATLMGLGQDDVLVSRCFDTEVRTHLERGLRRAWPARFYRKSIAWLNKIGSPSEHAEAADDVIPWIRSCKLESWADVYHPIPFFEFRDLSTQVNPEVPNRRLQAILSHWPVVQGARVLDLGCNVGFYSFSLAKRGAVVTGLDIRQEYVDIASRVAEIYKVAPTFLKMAVTPEWIRGLEQPLDITLCFSMLQWVIAQEGMAYGQELLRAISEKSKGLFFDIAVNAGKACLKSPPGDELAFVYRLLRDSTRYSKIKWVTDVQPYPGNVRHIFFCSH